MGLNGKLELTWVGKDDKKIIDKRILIEDKSKSYGDPSSENMLIHGDNLLALKALESKFAGQIKCIYIDPPYNIDAANEHYEDYIEVSAWLNIMRDRLQLLKKMLKNDGLIFVQIDDNLQAYLTVLMDGIFGKENHLNTICIKMSEPTGVKMTHANKRLPKLKEYVLVYKVGDVRINEILIPKEKWDDEYKILLTNVDKNTLSIVKDIMNCDEPTDELLSKGDALLKNIGFCNIEDYFKRNGIKDLKEKEKFKFDNSWRIIRDVSTTDGARRIADSKRQTTDENFFLIKTPKNKVYLIKNHYNMDSSQPRVKALFADEYLMINPCDLWNDITTTGLESEGGVEFKKSKKPEKLIQRIIEMSTCEDDIVLDSFLGSGTTAAVAHKMNRRFIGIEMGEHAYTHCQTRLNNVVDGTDKSGISADVNWHGGGGYHFYELSEPLFVKHPILNIYQVNPNFSDELFAEAVCSVENYTYKPCGNLQGYSSEKHYIHITREFVSGSYVQDFINHLDSDESVSIYCLKHQSDIRLPENVEIVDIMKSVLPKCIDLKEER